MKGLDYVNQSQFCPGLRQYGAMGALAGEDSVAGLGHEDVVFDADAELAGHVDAGFDS